MSLQKEDAMRKTPGIATTWGAEFEFKLAGLVALRARRAGLQFKLYPNLLVAGPADDLVLQVLAPHPCHYFVQQKHTNNRGTVKTENLIADSGNFSIAKYFDFFEDLRAKKWPKKLEDKEKSFLEEVSVEHTRFLLYTTETLGCRASGPPEDPALTSPPCEDPVEDLFLTGSRAHVTRFDAKDEKVWDLYAKSPDRQAIFRNEFLPRFKFYARQRHADKLDDLILEEIKSIFGGELPNAQKFLDGFLGFLKNWRQGHGRSVCLKHDTPELQMENLVAAEWRQSAVASAGQLAFREEFCEELSEALHRPGALRVLVRGVQRGLRAVKLLQILRRDFSERWAFIDEDIAREYSAKALDAVGRTCEVLVLDVPGETHRSLLRDLTETQKSGCKLVMLFGDRETFELFEEPQQLVDDWSIVQFTEEVQMTILKRSVLFQGTSMALEDLERTWPKLRKEAGGALLSALAQGDVATLGAAPPAPEEEVHIQRVLQHSSALDPAVLKHPIPKQDHLALSGFPQSVLKEMGRDLNVTNLDKNFRWTTLPGFGGGEAFKKLCAEHEGDNVHWIEAVGGEALEDVALVWRRSHGDPGVMVPFVRQANEACVREPLCVHAAGAAAADAILLCDAVSRER